MHEDAREQSLLLRAIAGDEDAVVELLWSHYDRLLRHVRQRIPAWLQSRVDAEDVLEDCFVYVWRNIAAFRPRGDDAFFAWLRTVTERKLLDAVRAHRAAKRGGAAAAAAGLASERSSFASLLDRLAVHFETPSRSAARREVEWALRVALTQLPDHYREAIALRYLEGRSIAEIAERMERTEAAVQMICQRAMKSLKGKMKRFASDRPSR